MRLGQAQPTRRGAPRLLIALVVASLLVTTAYFRERDDGPLHSMRRVMLAATGPISRVGGLVTAPVRAVGRGLSGLGTTKREAAALRAQNAQLRSRLAELEEARLQNERLSALMRFAERSDYEIVGARIIGRSSRSWEGSIVIDRGSNDGVREGMPVLAEGGLIGQVVESSPDSSRARLITDQRSGVAALVQRTRATGIVHGSIEGGLTLDFVAGKQAPKVGDVVITSGLGGVYPKGLVVGDVTEVAADRSALFPRVTVASRVELPSVEEVTVLVGRKGSDE